MEWGPQSVAARAVLASLAETGRAVRQFPADEWPPHA
jgi:hypothetical protein